MIQEYDECPHGVPGSGQCLDCITIAHRDEVRALNEEADRLTAAIDSALCMLCEGPDVISGREAREQAIKILYAAKKG